MAGYGLESTFGTAPAAPTKAWSFKGDKPVPRVEFATDEESLTGVQEEGSEAIPTRRWIEAEREFDARMDPLAYWLHRALGSIATTGTGPYVHTITNNGGEKPSVTEFWYDPLVGASKLETYPGLKVQRLTLRSVQGGAMSLTVSLIGKGAENDAGTIEVTATLPALNRDPKLGHSHITALTINSLDVKAINQELELVIEPKYNIQEEGGAGSLYVQQMECEGLAISVRVNFNHNANTKTLISQVLAQTGVPVAFTITRGAHSAVFNLYNVLLDDGAVTGQKAKLKKSFNGKAFYSVSDTKSMQAVVTNATAGTAYTA
jgi:hypothetical protein